jgi:transcription antitermination protein NusB
MTRTQSRQVAVKILYQVEIGRVPPEQACSDYWTHLAEDAHDAFADALVYGVLANAAEIDARIVELSASWRLERLFKINLVILRLGLYELLFTSTDKAVVIDEAVRVAKYYGADTGFINGILDKVSYGQERT